MGRIEKKTDGLIRSSLTQNFVRQETWQYRLDFHLTQFLNVHRCFPEYLHRFGKLGSAKCWYYGNDYDNVNATFFECDAWHTRRSRVQTLLGDELIPETVYSLMFSSPKKWRTISGFVHEMIEKKKAEERTQETQRRPLQPS